VPRLPATQGAVKELQARVDELERRLAALLPPAPPSGGGATGKPA
jgi:hypothetical protein